MKNEVSNQLNKRLGELKIKNDKENAASKKVHKAEIKSWRRELGAERKEEIKLEKLLANLESENKTRKFHKRRDCLCAAFKSWRHLLQFVDDKQQLCAFSPQNLA